MKPTFVCARRHGCDARMVTSAIERHLGAFRALEDHIALQVKAKPQGRYRLVGRYTRIEQACAFRIDVTQSDSEVQVYVEREHNDDVPFFQELVRHVGRALDVVPAEEALPVPHQAETETLPRPEVLVELCEHCSCCLRSGLLDCVRQGAVLACVGLFRHHARRVPVERARALLTTMLVHRDAEVLRLGLICLQLFRAAGHALDPVLHVALQTATRTVEDYHVDFHTKNLREYLACANA